MCFAKHCWPLITNWNVYKILKSQTEVKKGSAIFFLHPLKTHPSVYACVHLPLYTLCVTTTVTHWIHCSSAVCSFVFNTNRCAAWTSLPAGFSILIQHLAMLVLWCSCPHTPLPEKKKTQEIFESSSQPIIRQWMNYNEQLGQTEQKKQVLLFFLKISSLAYPTCCKNNKLATCPVWQCPPLDPGTWFSCPLSSSTTERKY